MRGAQSEGGGDMNGSDKETAGFPVAYDKSCGLMELVRHAFGPNPELFPFKGADVRMVNVRVEPILSGETCEQAVKRLNTAGHTLANPRDLIGFRMSHPEEVEKWRWVVAPFEEANSAGGECLLGARVDGDGAWFNQGDLSFLVLSDSGILVLCE